MGSDPDRAGVRNLAVASVPKTVIAWGQVKRLDGIGMPEEASMVNERVESVFKV